MREALAVFARLGYNGASIDDLLLATKLQRGSLYSTFFSKRGLFLQALEAALQPGWEVQAASLDLLIVALMELASTDAEVADLCRAALAPLGDPARLLGARLLSKLP